jgi:hypothetical protein
MTFDPDFASAVEWARLYRAKGVQVVPCNGKIPFLKSWKEYQNELVPEATFDRWYGAGGLYSSSPNMGMLTGNASGHVLMIDLDVYKPGGTAALNWWRGLLIVHNNNMLLETWEQVTGGGGFQLFFRYPASWKGAVNAKTDIHVDTRGQGGFAVLPPSLHASGRHYEWREGRGPWQIDILEAPPWLLEEVEKLVREHGGATGVSHETRSQPAPDASGEGIYDGFGNLRNFREKYMMDTIWAAMIGLRVECPIPPGSKEREAAWQQYERHVRPKDPAKGLNDEGRGRTEFDRKWDYALKKWEGPELAKAVLERQAEQTPPEKEQKQPGPITPPIGGPLIQTSAEFLAAYTPPAYLIDGIIQRGYLYSLTARTGHGKTAVALYMAQAIARGQDMHGCKVLPGTVLILAGENPDDVRARYFVLGKAYGFDPTACKIRWIPGVKHLPSHMAIIRQEAETIDNLVLVIVDTAAAYFPGTETNSNSEQGTYARLLRELTFLKGKPAAIALCHPVKNAARDNLLPMGGSAFTNEVDGNLTLWSGNEKQTTMHWQGKFRGPEFDPIVFEMVPEYCDIVKDESGRLLPSVVAKPMSQDAVEASEDAAEKDEDRLMRALYEAPRASFGKLGEKLGWKKRKVQTIMYRLVADKHVTQVRNQKYEITDKGRDAISALKGGK